MGALQRAMKGLKRIFKSSRTAIVTAFAVAGTILMVTSIQEWLPRSLSVLYMFLLGLFIVLIAGFIAAGGKKK